ncbi:MAG: hypothetical protein K0Q59_472 [Paenibacillus sp.]|nr:hypothetical protein [Paenibacillus sp.]
MAVIEVELGKFSRGRGTGRAVRTLKIRRRTSGSKRTPRSDRAEAAASLADEITMLRRAMEDAFMQGGDSLSTGKVMDISRMLDVKINEYMKAVQKN